MATNKVSNCGYDRKIKSKMVCGTKSSSRLCDAGVIRDTFISNLYQNKRVSDVTVSDCEGLVRN